MKKKELQSIDYIKQRADENLAKTKSVFLYRRELAIRSALRQKGFTQKKLAKRLKMTESYVSKLITGENLRFGSLCGKKNLRKRNLPNGLK